MRNNEKTVYWTKYILYVTAFFWVQYLAVFFHELGHAIAVVSLGGTLHELVVSWDFSGCVLWSWENVPVDSFLQMRTLVNVSGGIGAALFFMVLSHKSKWFTIPALFCVIDGFGEALYLADTRFNASIGMTTSVLFICMGLFWYFETGEQDMQRMKIPPRKRVVPEHIHERAMRALEKCVDKLEKKHEAGVLVYDELGDCEKKENEMEVVK